MCHVWFAIQNESSAISILLPFFFNFFVTITVYLKELQNFILSSLFFFMYLPCQLCVVIILSNEVYQDILPITVFCRSMIPVCSVFRIRCRLYRKLVKSLFIKVPGALWFCSHSITSTGKNRRIVFKKYTSRVVQIVRRKIHL